MPTSGSRTATVQAAKVLRFGRTERLVHWVHGAAFMGALFTGLSLYIGPLEVAIGHRFVLRVVHIASGVCFVFVPPLLARLGDWRSVTSDFAEAEWWDEDDRRFFSARLTGDEADNGRFNAGQKANMMFTLGATLFFGLSGIIMWQYFRFPAWLVQNAGLLHDSLTVAILIVWLGHLWYALVNPRTRHSIKGMVTGEVDRAWAADLHPRWLAQVESSRAVREQAIQSPQQSTRETNATSGTGA